jgi:hypothetical protein
MAKTWLSDEMNTVWSGYLSGTATAGVAGGPTQLRGTEFRAVAKFHRFTVECAATNPMPNAAAGNFATTDIIVLTRMKVIERIWFGRIYIGAGWGTGVTLTIGKTDLNNSSNTDAAHYKAATSVAAAGNFDLDLNMTEQVGDDPIGDQTTGQKIPQFGSGDIWITATIAGSVNTTGTLIGYIITTEEGN